MTATATATEMQNNFGRCLNLVMSGQEVIVTKNGREVGRFIPKDAAVSYLTDSLTGILRESYDLAEVKAERLKESSAKRSWQLKRHIESVGRLLFGLFLLLLGDIFL